MKARTSFSTRRGSVILVALICAVILMAVSAGILSYSLYTVRSSLRKLKLQQVRTVAANEMEYLFYRWSDEMDKSPAPHVTGQLSRAGKVVADASMTGALAYTTPFPGAFGADMKPSIPSVAFSRSLLEVPLKATGSVTNAGTGITRTGNVRYYTAKTRVRVNDPQVGPIEVRLGRRFTSQTISACAGAIYYQNEMEYGASGVLDVYGDIQSNGSIFMGAQPEVKDGSGNVVLTSALNIYGKIFYHGNFQGASDKSSGTQYAKDETKTLLTPNFEQGGRDAQVQKMNAADNMLGFGDPTDSSTDPAAIAARYPTAYPEGVNDIYRALVAPPPRTGGGALVEEDPRVAASRLYNKAGLRVEINGANVTVKDATGTDVSGSFTSIVPLSEIRKTITDKREDKTINLTTIDIGNLKTAIENLETSRIDSGWKFNGVLYVHDTTTPGTGELNGIRLKNASHTPGFDYSGSDGSSSPGFTVATENGLYIQGSYNTANNSAGEINRAAVMADAVTVLSDGWVDENSDKDVMEVRRATSNIVVNSAIMSGNMASVTETNAEGKQVFDTYDYHTFDQDGNPITKTLLKQSGGVQNLVRYLENWYTDNRTSTINGSLAQLFTSKYFNSYYKDTWQHGVYVQPASRQLRFDYALAASPPNGVPSSVTKYSRGDLFEWQLHD